MDGPTYKESKEAFVSGQVGSTVTQINLVSLGSLASVLLYYTAISRFNFFKRVRNSATAFLADFTFLVIPLLLSVTYFAGQPVLLSLILAIPAGIALLITPHLPIGSPLPSNLDDSSRPPSPVLPPSGVTEKDASSAIIIPPLPTLTVYRAHMLLLTAICILAVDFPIFPRSLAKCETFGVSIMDLGVGSFVFSQGLVSALPILKDPGYLSGRLTPKVLKTARKMTPVLVLGFVRLIMVKGTQYPEHESEYGTHWNFFFTLSILPVLQALLHPFIARLPISLIGVFVAVAHQFALSLTSLQQYTIEASRTGLVSANKEGLVSLPGYLAIHLLGLSLGTMILPANPSEFRRRQRQLYSPSKPDRIGHPTRIKLRAQPDKKALDNGAFVPRQRDKTATELAGYAILWWTMFGLVGLLGLGTSVSRRLANLPYTLWTVAFNTTFILGYLLLDMAFVPGASSPPWSSGKSLKGTGAPMLFEAVNRNGLVFFLVANVATGLVNLSIPTMYAPDLKAFVILSLYSLAVSCFAWLLRGRRLI